MSVSSIEITFTEDLPLGAQLGFDFYSDGGPYGMPSSYPIIYDWVTIRSANNQVTLGTETLNAGERAAINFVQAFSLDYSGFTVSRAVNVVTISIENGLINYEFHVNGIFATYTNHPSLDFVTTNPGESSMTITEVEYETADTNPCENVKVKVTTSELATKITSPVTVDPNTDNPFYFEMLRGIDANLIVENSLGLTASQVLSSPKKLVETNFNLQINNSPNGATLIVNSESYNTTGLNLEYSLDDDTWQTSNIFNGLIPGNYTLYVRDQLGCSFSKDFNVDEYGLYTPYFYISKANSIRFANRITWGDSSNYKNDENTLSCEVDVELPYKEIQQFQSADVIKTQFKSNYSSNVVKIIKSDLSEVTVPVVKMSNNIGRKDKRDAVKYDLGDGKTGIYFTSGNIYDYDTAAIIGTHSLNGLLPMWGRAFEYVNIDAAWYQIEDVIYDDQKNVEVLVISNNYSGPDTAVIAGSIFNVFDYEVYEFTIDMVGYIDEYFSVKITATDDHFSTINYLSEQIWCKVKHDDVLEIRYRNSTNTDIFYSTGIEHLIRIPYTFVKGKDENESEVHKTDTDAILLKADIYESEDFIFEPVTKEIWRKMKIALSHENVFINGVGYVKNSDFGTEGPMEKSNLYVLTATMIKTGNVYNSSTSGDIDFNSSSAEIPGLIESDAGFVRY
jgi:hypothetical protein